MNLDEARKLFIAALDDGKAQKHRRKMRRNLKMYMGKQWSADDEAKLKDDGRVPIVINEILRQVNAVCGLESQNKTDFYFYPIDEFADVKVADVLNKVVKNVQDFNEFEFVESDVFRDGMIMDQGVYCIKPDFEKDIQGEIKISRHKPERTFCDPDSEQYDRSDADYLGYWEWMTARKVKAKYPKAKEIEFPEGESDEISESMKGIDDEGVKTTGEDYHDPDHERDGLSIFYQAEKKKVRVVHMWHRDYEKRQFVMSSDGSVEEVTGQVASEVKGKIRIINDNGGNLQYIEREYPITKYIVFTHDQTLIEDDIYPYAVPGTYPLVDYFAWFRDGETLSFVDPLIDPQMERNKRRVQALHAMNASGFVYQEGALYNEDEVRQFGARPDIHIKLNPGMEVGRHFQRYEPTSIKDVVLYEEMSKADIKEIGVNPDLLGLQQPRGDTSTSGILVEIRQKAGMIGLEGFMRNFMRTKRLVLRQVLHLIQNLWTMEKTIRLIGSEDYITLNEMGLKTDERGVPMIDPRTEQAITKTFNDVSVGRYDVKIAESSATPTQKQKTFAQAIELGKLIAQASGFFPSKSMVRLSDFPNKEEMIQEVAEGEQARQQLEMLKFTAQAKPKGTEKKE